VSSEGAVLTRDHRFIEQVVGAVRRAYGERLVSIALFGSVARGTARPDSDVDLFLVVEQLPRGRRARLATFDPVEQELAGEIDSLATAGVTTELSPVLRTPEDLRTASPLLLDLTEDAVIIADRGGILAAALADLRQRLQRLGSRRIWIGTRWYWDLKPDYRRGEIIRL
jgi:predicted nucleotidyltransferase